MHESRHHRRDQSTIAGERRSSARVDAILAGLRPGLPVWDLCCDAGQIGCVAMDRDADVSVLFVDKRPKIAAALALRLARDPRYATRSRVVCADVLRMDLPAEPANVVIAGVGTNLIHAFLDRLVGRREDRLICSTSQNVERFERLAALRGLRVESRHDVESRHGRQAIWTLSPF